MADGVKLPYTALSYDAGIRKTLPYYDRFFHETVDLVRAIHPHPKVWLDTGCGTGEMVRVASEAFPKTRFVLSDPDPEMLRSAEAKILAETGKRFRFLPPMGSEGLAGYRGRLRSDVVTAIQCHHYLSPSVRLRAVKACREILSPGGVLVVFENVAPETQEGIRLGLKRWATFQVSNGKTKSEAEKHVGRYGKGFFPITPRAHLALFKRAGFRTAELFWLSHLQAGFYAIR